MDNGRVNDSLSNSQDEPGQSITNAKIPGGEKQILPKEPDSSEGCTSPKRPAPVDDEKCSASEQGKNEKDSKPKQSNNNDRSTLKDQKRAKQLGSLMPDPKSATPVTSISDGDDNDEEKDLPNEPTSRVTRSLLSSKLNISFEDTDDEENSLYLSWAQRDIADYRDNYPNLSSNSKIKDNYDFYMNKTRSYPDGDFIDNIHKKWFGDYHRLEIHHGYIQWLFPLQEQGLNWSAEALQKHEIKLIKADKTALKRILQSYKLMLDFYGFELVDEETGEIRRLSNGGYKSRFHNLNTSGHNYLRITRILKCLGEFDYEYLKFPFLEQILRESITQGTLPNCLRSCKYYWIETLRSQDERRAIRLYARELLDYRKKRILPPQTHRAARPSLTSTKKEQKAAVTDK